VSGYIPTPKPRWLSYLIAVVFNVALVAFLVYGALAGCTN